MVILYNIYKGIFREQTAFCLLFGAAIVITIVNESPFACFWLMEYLQGGLITMKNVVRFLTGIVLVSDLIEIIKNTVAVP